MQPLSELPAEDAPELAGSEGGAVDLTSAYKQSRQKREEHMTITMNHGRKKSRVAPVQGVVTRLGSSHFRDDHFKGVREPDKVRRVSDDPQGRKEDEEPKGGSD